MSKLPSAGYSWDLSCSVKKTHTHTTVSEDILVRTMRNFYFFKICLETTNCPCSSRNPVQSSCVTDILWPCPAQSILLTQNSHSAPWAQLRELHLCSPWIKGRTQLNPHCLKQPFSVTTELSRGADWCFRKKKKSDKNKKK